MLAQLTFTIDKDVIKMAKKYAQIRNPSVSRLVEDYLKTVSDTANIRNNDMKLESSLTDSITGMFKEDYSGKPYKEILESALADKYL
ncbi:MAG: DUF6364 family protein [Spirochaetia bacterium]|jgi:hypothetical protein|nr:DUF6364 family protein [Spirochaetia bacterium]